MYIELNSSLALEQAGEQDLDECLGIIEEVSGGLLPFLLEPLDVRSALSLVAEQNSLFSGENMYVLKEKSRPGIRALLFAYRNHYQLPAIVSTMMSQSKYELLCKVILPRTEDSFYINTLYVAHSVRNLGLARLLLDVARIMAGEQGCRDICLHCFNDQQHALNLYFSCGYQLIEQISYFGELAQLHPRGGSILSFRLQAPE